MALACASSRNGAVFVRRRNRYASHPPRRRRFADGGPSRYEQVERTYSGNIPSDSDSADSASASSRSAGSGQIHSHDRADESLPATGVLDFGPARCTGTAGNEFTCTLGCRPRISGCSGYESRSDKITAAGRCRCSKDTTRRWLPTRRDGATRRRCNRQSRDGGRTE
jgi:hypothetical protein